MKSSWSMNCQTGWTLQTGPLYQVKDCISFLLRSLSTPRFLESPGYLPPFFSPLESDILSFYIRSARHEAPVGFHTLWRGASNPLWPTAETLRPHPTPLGQTNNALPQQSLVGRPAEPECSPRREKVPSW